MRNLMTAILASISVAVLVCLSVWLGYQWGQEDEAEECLGMMNRMEALLEGDVHGIVWTTPPTEDSSDRLGTARTGCAGASVP